jgi:hypothetical protein
MADAPDSKSGARLAGPCGRDRGRYCPCEPNDADLHRFEENRRLVERGRLEVPLGADLGVFASTFIGPHCSLGGMDHRIPEGEPGAVKSWG